MQCIPGRHSGHLRVASTDLRADDDAQSISFYRSTVRQDDDIISSYRPAVTYCLCYRSTIHCSVNGLPTCLAVCVKSSRHFSVIIQSCDCMFIGVSYVITCAPAMLRAGIAFGGVGASICPHKISKTKDQKLM